MFSSSTTAYFEEAPNTNSRTFLKNKALNLKLNFKVAYEVH